MHGQFTLSCYIDIYPNPALDVLRISHHGSASNAVRVEMYDVLGRQVRTQEFVAGVANIEIGDLTRGVYLVRAYDGAIPIAGRMVVVR